MDYIDMPVRKIKKSYRNVTGVSSACKSVGEAQFESTLERDFLRLLEFFPDVKEFEVQPVTLRWQDESGAKRHYTPDVSVQFYEDLGRKPWLCEVKYRADLKKNWPELYPKFRQAIKYARQQGARFRLITEVEIRTTELEAAKFLLPYRRRPVATDKLLQVSELIRDLTETSPGVLIGQLASEPSAQAEWLTAIWKLASQFEIGIDFQQPLSMASRIWSLK